MRSLLPTITERLTPTDTLNPHTPRQQPNGHPSVKGIQHETSLYNIRTTHTGESTHPPYNLTISNVKKGTGLPAQIQQTPQPAQAEGLTMKT